MLPFQVINIFFYFILIPIFYFILVSIFLLQKLLEMIFFCIDVCFASTYVDRHSKILEVFRILFIFSHAMYDIPVATVEVLRNIIASKNTKYFENF